MGTIVIPKYKLPYFSALLNSYSNRNFNFSLQTARFGLNEKGLNLLSEIKYLKPRRKRELERDPNTQKHSIQPEKEIGHGTFCYINGGEGFNGII